MGHCPKCDAGLILVTFGRDYLYDHLAMSCEVYDLLRYWLDEAIDQAKGLTETDLERSSFLTRSAELKSVLDQHAVGCPECVIPTAPMC